MINWKKVQQVALSARYRSNPRPDELSDQEARPLPKSEPAAKSLGGLPALNAYLDPLEKGEAKVPAGVDAEQLEQGIAVEMEHTSDPGEARKIALDHLAEDPKYYTALKEMEARREREMAAEKSGKGVGPGGHVPDGTGPHGRGAGPGGGRGDGSGVAKSLPGIDAVEDYLSKAGGPFIGPKGGRWADASHTVPWKEGEKEEPKKSQKELLSSLSAYGRSEVLPEYQKDHDAKKLVQKLADKAIQIGITKENFIDWAGPVFIRLENVNGDEWDRMVHAALDKTKRGEPVQKSLDSDSAVLRHLGVSEPMSKAVPVESRNTMLGARDRQAAQVRGILAAREASLVIEPPTGAADDNAAALLIKALNLPAGQGSPKVPLINQHTLCKSCGTQRSAVLSTCPCCGSGGVISEADAHRSMLMPARRPEDELIGG